jgi:diguanylate cyclase (GGDEF)-like protein/PAS domain S-box-containing protein
LSEQPNAKAHLAPSGEELQARRERTFRALVEGTTHLICLLAADGTLEYASPSLERLLGYRPEDLIGTNALGLLHPEDLATAFMVITANSNAPADGLMARDDLNTASQWRLRHRDGHYVTLEVLGNNFLANEEIRAILVIAQDRSAQRVFEDALIALSKSALAPGDFRVLLDVLDASFRDTLSALYLADDRVVVHPPRLDAELSYVHRAAPWVLAVERNENIIIDDIAKARETGALDEEIARVAEQAGYRACWCLVVSEQANASAATPRALGCLVTWSSRHEKPLFGYEHTIAQVLGLAQLSLSRRRYEHELHHAATHDHLTGLYNRLGFLGHVGSGEIGGALLVIDLDDFKHVNDMHGHLAGDGVLVALADAMRQAIRPGDVLARFGGDEFALFLPNAEQAVAQAVARRLIERASAPIPVGGDHAQLRVSVGIDTHRELGLEARIARADGALYLAKRHGGNSFASSDELS